MLELLGFAPLPLGRLAGCSVVLLCVALVVVGLDRIVWTLRDLAADREAREAVFPFLMQIPAGQGASSVPPLSPFECYRDADGFLRIEDMAPCDESAFYDDCEVCGECCGRISSGGLCHCTDSGHMTPLPAGVSA